MIKAIATISSIVLIYLYIVYLVVISFVQEAEIEVLTKDLKETIAKHNELNHKLIEAKHRVDELESANEALIEATSDTQFRKAAKHTELPKLKGC